MRDPGLHLMLQTFSLQVGEWSAPITHIADG